MRPILHVRLFHPTNDHYGMSPIEAAAVAIDIHNTASRWNKALLDNSARPSGALVYSARDGALSPEQYDRLKRELESGFQGAAQAGRPLLLEGGLDWKAMSLTPKDMDFIEAKHAAAREIALALGVPPMLLAIPGDNTYSNYQEAQRAFWRQTVLPLVNRTAKALSGWLAPAYGDNLVLRPDLDQIPALMSEREQLWTMLDKATFLTPDEKRAAAGYAPADKAGTASNHNFNPHHADNGQFTFAPGGATVQPAAGGRRGPPGNPAQMQRLDGAVRRAEAATRRVRELDPNWQRTPGAHSSDIEGQIADQTARAQEAEARLAELMQGSVPNTNPSWGYQRFRKELLDQGYEFVGPARRGVGEQFTDPVTGETVRIMRRPIGDPWPSDPAGKFYQDYYYRYSYPRSGEFPHVPLPNK